ncbi:ATPase [Pycnococcus provasolii]
MSAQAGVTLGTFLFALVYVIIYASIRYKYSRRQRTHGNSSNSGSSNATGGDSGGQLPSSYLLPFSSEPGHPQRGDAMAQRARAVARTAQWTSAEEALVHVLTATAVVCCWLAWVIVYIAQSHPLVNPVLSEGQYNVYRFS